MRYFLLLVLMIFQNIYAEEIKPLQQGDTWRKYIALSLRDEEGLQGGLFNLRRIEANSNIAYVCGLIKGKNDNFITDGQHRYHLYDRVMVINYQWSWVSAVRFDKTVVSPQDAHCHYGKEVQLTSALLNAQVAAQGRKNICQPVKASDPLRSDILNGLRASYIGDSNNLNLNGSLPTVKFIVKALCATEDYAYFYGKPTGDKASYFIHDDANNGLRVILKKSTDGVWRPVPENRMLTQQSKVDDKYYGVLQKGDLARLAQVCMVEGDTVDITGTLQQQGEDWTVTPDKPFACVRDADTNKAGWNQRMQLVLTRQEKELLKDLPRKKVQVSGDIFLALSTAHHTPLLLDNIFRLKELSK
ncbi:DUF4431 domain-containing protein [Salmonella enterica]|uniref:DUF4431 domain-containing protein n=2 Tax=Salmonella enterica TaxID=28901 RepID=A0A701ZFH7_SALER|nr:DUF4431 domain-containing protein [Salmonella enterica]EBH9039874.1 DUF4431 domain-containing protein [Salmonella enterica subsp. indica serovar 11:b:e,n,x]EEJ9033470.1 DUF4431 domain-containing protein [Salmonella enterica subsp. enterica serovar Oslo]ESE84521.1 hypothetical protein SEI61121_12631 [Salmonella enterica subsp. indica serovar 6,14,25:z10:1,(2),7 str. 1121]HAC6563731.1 DUF4431 domain-containing protein [Salmonella enterica subsp. indica]HCM1933448.1 DUF4431 domain-containing p